MESIQQEIERLEALLGQATEALSALKEAVGLLSQEQQPEFVPEEKLILEPELEPEPEPEPELEPEPEPEPELEPVSTKATSQQSSRADILAERFSRQNSNELRKKSSYGDCLSNNMSLNDRFRYLRELFDNNPEKMNQAMSVIDNMSCIEEVKDYFSAMNWDDESSTVQDFYTMIETHFTICQN